MPTLNLFPQARGKEGCSVQSGLARPYTAISKDGSTKSGVQSLLERWNTEINGRLRWLGPVSRSGGYRLGDAEISKM